MATTTRTETTRTNLLTYSAYALLGAGDAILDQARRLAAHRDELPDQALAQLNEAIDDLRQAVDDAVEELGQGAVRRRTEATSTLDDLAERGRGLFTRLSREQDVDEAKGDVDQARAGVKGAVTAILNTASTAVSRVRAAGTLSAGAADSVADATGTVAQDLAGTRHDKPLEDHTKAELYELATARDIDGRSTMSKDELVTALGR